MFTHAERGSCAFLEAWVWLIMSASQLTRVISGSLSSIKRVTAHCQKRHFYCAPWSNALFCDLAYFDMTLLWEIQSASVQLPWIPALRFIDSAWVQYWWPEAYQHVRMTYLTLGNWLRLVHAILSTFLIIKGLKVLSWGVIIHHHNCSWLVFYLKYSLDLQKGSLATRTLLCIIRPLQLKHGQHKHICWFMTIT